MSTMNDTNPQRRVFTRIPFAANVELDLLPDKYACNLLDISLKGALVEQAQPWSAVMGAPCSVSIELAEDGPTIHMTGEVAHVDGGRLGMRCTEIDLESMTNLRRLVELNLGDEAALNREIHAMVSSASKD